MMKLGNEERNHNCQHELYEQQNSYAPPILNSASTHLNPTTNTTLTDDRRFPLQPSAQTVKGGLNRLHGDVITENDLYPDDFNYDDEDIQRDAADDTIVLIVHIALAFFILLFFVALTVSIIIVGQYGFLIFMMVCALLFLGLTIGYFVSKIMDRDRVLKPVRRKIRRWHAIATAVVVKEMKDFQLDIQDHLLLTNGPSGDTDMYGYSHHGEDDINGIGSGMKRKGSRSKIFKIFVKPLLKKKNSLRFGRQKKSTENTTSNQFTAGATHETV